MTNLVTQSQLNYVIGEEELPLFGEKSTKGPLLVMNLLGHWIQQNATEQRSIAFHCDNCGGQNKNNFLMHFMMFLILIGIPSYFFINSYRKI